MAADRAAAALTLEAVTRRFRTGSATVDALCDVDGAVPAGTLTVVAGPSGSGKSTLLTIIGCLDRPTSGVVRYDTIDIAALSRRDRRRLRRREIGIVLPAPHENLLIDRTARENVEWSARMRGASADGGDSLERVGLADRADTVAGRLSGGEQQRVAIAAAMAGRPRLVVADEPTASLDAESGRDIAARLTAITRGDAPVTVVVASHDPVIIEVADHVIRLDHGRHRR